MKVIRIGSQPSSIGPATNFSGHARRDPLFTAPAPSRLATGTVTFDPGARTVWHTHPVGQLLIVTAGAGRVGRWGGEIAEVSAGDIVWFDPEEKHWHGASPTVGMTHIAITEAVNGSAVEWLEPVTDEQYSGKASW